MRIGAVALPTMGMLSRNPVPLMIAVSRVLILHNEQNTLGGYSVKCSRSAWMWISRPDRTPRDEPCP
ncbi:hypothetical protein DFR68_10460 [Nocardia mexicana]|uniref:Uncharacterized protein n=1 Tax=Nocardia mexicana TaxID=279262 RepID=A0A370H593_9NOCA|nr:hypothetical protein DFR68_10460 [Nocardia mexicana]